MVRREKVRREKLKEIRRDLKKKIVILTGPRQCGKTTLAKSIHEDFDYLNYDNPQQRARIIKLEWDKKKPIIIFDELHKMDGWKRFLKGVYDVDGIPPELFVTGSAKLDVFRKVGDSLAGRFFKYHLDPFDVRELHTQLKSSPDEILDQMLETSNFPEPFLSGKASFYRRWSRGHLEVILRQDLLDLTTVHDIPKIELLIELLRSRVGGTVSFANLAQDLEKDPNTVKRWLQLLEDLYVIFKATPYHKNIARSLLKEPKYYFYDIGQVKDPAAKLENCVACALLKKLHDIEDLEGYETRLHYLRTRDGKEIDFLALVDKKPRVMIEVKTADGDVSRAFSHFSNQISGVRQLQLVKNIDRSHDTRAGVRVQKMADWLTTVAI